MTPDDISNANEKEKNAAQSDAIQDLDANVDATDAKNVKGGFNPQPDPPRIRSFDPQPDPPIFNAPKQGY